MATTTESENLLSMGESRRRRLLRVQRLAKALGWFSIGLGAAELLSPEFVAGLAGTKGHGTLIRAFGLREMGAGVGILAQPRDSQWLWARVAGDVLDLVALGAVIGALRNRRSRAIAATAAVAGVTALDVICAQRMEWPARY